MAQILDAEDRTCCLHSPKSATLQFAAKGFDAALCSDKAWHGMILTMPPGGSLCVAALSSHPAPASSSSSLFCHLIFFLVSSSYSVSSVSHPVLQSLRPLLTLCSWFLNVSLLWLSLLGKQAYEQDHYVGVGMFPQLLGCNIRQRPDCLIRVHLRYLLYHLRRVFWLSFFMSSLPFLLL